jgi:hypothetical protein
VASADRAVGADFTQGPRLARLDGVPPILLPGASRVAGGAYDVLPLGDGRHWSTIHFMGARLLEETPEGAFVSLSHASDGGILRDLLGPFGDGSAWALVVESGIRRLALSPGGDIELSPATDLPRVWKADLTEDLRLAAGARGRAGVVLFRVNPADGTILETAPLHDPELGHAEDVAWISHELLAIADEGGVIRFHRVAADLSTKPAGWWRLPVTPDRAVSLDSNGFELMIATARARIVVVDITGLRGNAWMLF